MGVPDRRLNAGNSLPSERQVRPVKVAMAQWRAQAELGAFEHSERGCYCFPDQVVGQP
jgi:hypothetical protein